MDNKKIAALFAQMADLTEILAGEPFRVRAFRRSARVIENLPESAQTMIRRGTLARVAGIGEGTLLRVKEILRTGGCEEHRALRSRVPPGLPELLRVEGIGPRTVRTLWTHLGIGTLEELELALVSSQLGRVPGMAERTRSRITRGLESYRRRSARTPLAEALGRAERIVASLRALDTVLSAEVAGSLRRRRDTIKDMDVVVSTHDSPAVLARFVTLPGVQEVLSRSSERASVRLESGEKVELLVTHPRHLGAAMHYFTGSQLHNIAVRLRAGRCGLKISEDGVFDSAGRLLAGGETEEEVFAAVGLPWIPPEIREDCGEIEVAEAGRLPRLLEAGDLRGDLHMHTVDSDGGADARTMVEAAARLGREYVAITDHSKSSRIARGLDEARLAAQGTRLRRLQSQFGEIRVLAGVEVDILPDGSLDLDLDLLAGLDWVVASVHSHLDMNREEMTARLVAAIESGVVDCIGHPTGRRLGKREGALIDLERILAAAARSGVAVELNCNPGRLDLDAAGCRQARQAGVLVAIDTDAHSPEDLERMRYGVYTGRRGWLEASDVLNCRGWDEVAGRRRDRLRRGGIQVGELRERDPAAATDEPVEGVDALAVALAAPVLDEDLTRRLRSLLEGGRDAALREALSRLAPNPLQKAFDLLVPEEVKRSARRDGG